MTSATITRSLVADLPPVSPGGRKYRVNDDKIAGFHIEMRASGRATYYLRYTDPRGRRRETKIGRHGDITTEQARKRAAQLKASITLGGDPAGERDRMRAVPTFAAFVAERFMPHARDTIRSHAEYEAMMRLRLLPAFGRLRLDEITVAGVAEFRRDLIAEGLSSARVNRHLAVLRSSLNLALRWDLFAGRNPAQSPGMLREEPRERFLTEVELRALMLALGQDADRVAASAVALLALTGARKAEVLGARWEHVDFDHRLLTVPLSKSGRRRHVVLPDAAIAVLELQPRAPDQPFVFPSARRPGKPVEDVRGVWARAKTSARLPNDLRLHDLRHNFASLAINGGASLYEVGRLLGHSQLSTTARYAHLSAGRLLETANTVGRIATGGTGGA
jgi:integrase